MRGQLKVYELILDVKGPVFVGSGNEINKKEYVFLKGDRIGVIDFALFYQLVRRKHLTREFENYMLGNSKEDLNKWLIRNRIPLTEVVKCLRYTLNGGGRVNNISKTHIMEFIKDPYGNPYVPGSSIKGMLRTVLLAGDIIQNPRKYSNDAARLPGDLRSFRGNRKHLLAKNIAEIENEKFRILQRMEPKHNAVNDIMSGLIVSDSDSLDIQDLVLCQKYDRHRDASETALPIARECLRPGTRIRCTLTIDEGIAHMDVDQLRESIAMFANQYYENFSKNFPATDRLGKDNVFLGGGVGFLSKTIIYPLFPGKEGVKITKQIFDRTRPPKKRGDYPDLRESISPYVLKCTRYKGKSLQMGLCKMQINAIR